MSESQAKLNEIISTPDIQLGVECNELAENANALNNEELQYYHRSEVMDEIKQIMENK